MGSGTKIIVGMLMQFMALALGMMGLILSGTGIGACIGIPMILLAMLVFVLGVILAIMAKLQYSRESIAAALKNGSPQRVANAVEGSVLS